MLFRPAVGHLVVVAWMGCWMVTKSGGVIVQTSETYVTFPGFIQSQGHLGCQYSRARGG